MTCILEKSKECGCRPGPCKIEVRDPGRIRDVVAADFKNFGCACLYVLMLMLAAFVMGGVYKAVARAEVQFQQDFRR